MSQYPPQNPGPYPPQNPGQYPPQNPGQYTPPQPGQVRAQYFPPQQPPKPKRSYKTLFIVLGIVVVLCCAGGIGTAFWGVDKFRGAVGAVRGAAAEYLDAVQAGDLDGAYGQLCSRSRSTFTRDEYAAETPKISSYHINGTSVSNINGVKTGTVTSDITLESGTSIASVLNLIKEQDDWRVCLTA